VTIDYRYRCNVARLRVKLVRPFGAEGRIIHSKRDIYAMGPFAAARLPPEIWQVIFEKLTTHDLHIFDQSVRRRFDAGNQIAITAIVLPLAPRLTHVDFIQKYNFSNVLSGLPRSVSATTLSVTRFSFPVT
jgi:hypothetical protein